MAEKRDLVFLWINEGDDGIFKDQNVNFGSEYEFKVTREGASLRLSAERNRNFIQGFFSVGDRQINNLTAIVGKNGSGKSALCRIIGSVATDGGSSDEYIAVVRVKPASGEPTYVAYRRFYAEVHLELDPMLSLANDSRVDLGVSYGIYYSPIMDAAIPYGNTRHSSIQDISATKLLQDEFNKTQLQVADHQVNDLPSLIRSMDFAFHMALLSSEGGQRVLSTVSDAVDRISSYTMRFVKPKDNAFVYSRTTHALNEVTGFLSFCFQREYDALVEAMFSSPPKVDDVSEAMAKLFVLEFGNHLLTFYLFHLGNKAVVEQAYDINPLALKSLDFIPRLTEFFRAQTAFDKELLIQALETADSISPRVVTNAMRDTYTLKPADLKRLFQVHDRLLWALHAKSTFAESTHERQEFMSFDYSHALSSGQKAYMDLFSRLFWAKRMLDVKSRRRGDSPESVTVILDEGELGFHPAWQQGYVKALIKGLSKLFANSAGQVSPRLNVVIATHSPITLSDIPREHVVVLQTLQQRTEGSTIDTRTFGANIHDLYRNSFFLADHMLGHFAHDKIQDVLNDLNGDATPPRSRLQEMDSIIDQIGEPVIRKELHRQYELKFPDVANLDERIHVLAIRLAHLRKLRDDEAN